MSYSRLLWHRMNVIGWMLKPIVSLSLKLSVEDKSGITPLNNTDIRETKYSTIFCNFGLLEVFERWIWGCKVQKYEEI